MPNRSITELASPFNIRLFLGQNVASSELLDHALKKCGIERYEILKNPYGKPYLKDNPVYFNLSHSGTVSLCAVSKDYEIGVDIEENTYREHIVNRHFTDREKQDLRSASDSAPRTKSRTSKFTNQHPQPDSRIQDRFTEIWTLKEAFMKSSGEGLSLGLSNISIDF